MRMRLATLALLLLASGCGWTHDHIVAPVDAGNVDPHWEGVFVTAGDLPAASYTPVAFIHATHYGLYLFWEMPVVSATTRKVIDERLVREAKKRGADAVIEVHLSYSTTPGFPYSLVTLGTVVREVDADGMAVKLKDPSAWLPVTPTGAK